MLQYWDRIHGELQELFARVSSSCICLATLPAPGLHELPFVESLRRRDDATVIEVRVDNRDGLVDRWIEGN